jgi:hypothetical protein
VAGNEFRHNRPHAKEPELFIVSNPVRLSALCALLVLGACTTVPSGPSVMALPGTGRSFQQFRSADADCRQFAADQFGGATGNQAAVESGVKSAALATTVGALAGAAIDGQQGAGVGAGMGLILGSVAGIEAGQATARDMQGRYDIAYIQCMYAKGHRVPVSGRLLAAPTDTVNLPANGYAMPPPGRQPPPDFRP